MIILKASIDDYKEILALISLSFDEYKSYYTLRAYNEVICSKEVIFNRFTEGPVYKILINHVIVGTISIVFHSNHVYIRGMAVAPEIRQKSLGWKMLNHVEREALNKKKEYLILHTTPFLDKAIRLYEKFGFQETETNPKEHLFGTPLIKMIKPL